MRKLVLLLALTNCTSAFAQTVRSFSGVFFETQTKFRDRVIAPHDPLVLHIEQSAEILRFTEFQNGSHATFVYNINGKPSVNPSPGYGLTEDRLKVKDGSLLLTSVRKGAGVNDGARRETWQLSPDAQTLSIQVRLEHPGYHARREFLWVTDEIYTRQTTLEDALGNAAKSSSVTNCTVFPNRPGAYARDISRGVVLGGTLIDHLGWSELFDANLRGNFFTGLRLIPTANGVEVRKNQELISRFSGHLILTVWPSTRVNPRWIRSTSTSMMGRGRFTDSLKNLRFHVLWVGPDSRDLGEIPAKLETFSESKKLPPDAWYQMEIPAQDVPITDSLEIHILSAAGIQLGCISGHL